MGSPGQAAAHEDSWASLGTKRSLHTGCSMGLYTLQGAGQPNWRGQAGPRASLPTSPPSQFWYLAAWLEKGLKGRAGWGGGGHSSNL